MSAVIPSSQRDALIVEALDRHTAGDSLRQIAPALGISHVTLRAMLLGDVPEKYREAQQASFLRRIAEADELLEQATDALGISKAREIAKFARWDAERRLPHLFGQRVEVKQIYDISDDIRRISEERRAKRAIIDAAPAAESQG